MLYMSDDVSKLEETIKSRKHLYVPNLEENWKSAQPIWKETAEGEQILEIMGFEVMSSYQMPYMRRLAEVVTRNGGNILNIGYGLGLIDNEIEQYRETCHIDQHYVIELNCHIATKAREVKC